MLKVALELSSGAFTLASQYLGSTTLNGSVSYSFASVLWITWLLLYRQWGFIPITVAGAGIGVWNLAHAL